MTTGRAGDQANHYVRTNEGIRRAAERAVSRARKWQSNLPKRQEARRREDEVSNWDIYSYSSLILFHLFYLPYTVLCIFFFCYFIPLGNGAESIDGYQNRPGRVFGECDVFQRRFRQRDRCKAGPSWFWVVRWSSTSSSTSGARHKSDTSDGYAIKPAAGGGNETEKVWLVYIVHFWLCYLFVRLLIRFSHLSIHSFANFYSDSFIHPFIHSFILSFVRSFTLIFYSPTPAGSFRHIDTP